MQIYITKDGQQLGPYTIDQARELVAAGTVMPNDWSWYDGLADWIPLSQVPGFSLPPPAPLASAPVYAPPAAAKAPVPLSRPVLVWIICIFYFICTPIGMVVFAGLPYLIKYTEGALEQADTRLDSALSQTKDPAARDRLVQVQERLRTSKTDLSRVSNLGVTYILTTELVLLLNLSGAVCLFLLRKVALVLLGVALLVGAGYSVYMYTLGGLNLGSNIVGLGISWTINILIILYVWNLRRTGVLR